MMEEIQERTKRMYNKCHNRRDASTRALHYIQLLYGYIGSYSTLGGTQDMP